MEVLIGYKITYKVNYGGVVEFFWDATSEKTPVLDAGQIVALLTLMNSGKTISFDQIHKSLTIQSNYVGNRPIDPLI